MKKIVFSLPSYQFRHVSRKGAKWICNPFHRFLAIPFVLVYLGQATLWDIN